MAKILIVEDNEDLASLMRIELIRRGHDPVDITQPGRVKHMRLDNFDMAVVDYSFESPAFDNGVDVCKYLSKHDIPCIIVTGSRIKEDEGFMVVYKPFAMDDLQQAIELCARKNLPTT